MDILHSLGIDLSGLITQIIGFVILLAIAARFAYKPLFTIIDQRQADIKATYDALDEDRRKMDEARKEYAQRLANIEAEAREKIQEAVREAQALRDNLVADAQKQAEAIIEKGRNESERERQKAFMEMRQQIVALSISAAGKVIGETLDQQRHTQLVDSFITSVGAGAVADSGRGVSGNTIGERGATLQ